MSGGSKEQTQSTMPDPQTLAYRQQIFDRAQQVSNQPYTPYQWQTVADASPLSQDGVYGMQNALGQMNSLYQQNLNANERALYTGQELNNLGGQFGQQAGGFDSLAGRMRGAADQYANTGNQMLGLGGLFDQQAQGMQDYAQTYDQRAAGMDQWGQQFNPYINAGNTGARALGGDQGAVSQMFNPFQQNVLSAVGSQYDDLRSQANRESNDAAARAGAFGGSRHGVMQGARLGEIDQGQGQTMAQLQYQGFNDAMNRANQAANLGLGAGGLDLQGRQVGQADRAQGLQARQIGQNYNQLGLDARGLGATFGSLGLDAEQVGQGYNQLGATYNNMGLDARNLGLQAQQLGLGALGQAQGAAQGGANVAGQLFGAGDYYRNIQQQYLDDQQRRFNEARDWDVRNLDILKSGLTGMPFGQIDVTKMDSDMFGQLLGAGLTGWGIYNQGQAG